MKKQTHVIQMQIKLNACREGEENTLTVSFIYDN